MLLLSIFIPLIAGIIMFILPQRANRSRAGLAVLAAALNFFVAWQVFEKNLNVSLPWLSGLAPFALRTNVFSGFILFSGASFTVLAFIYSAAFMRGRDFLKQYYGYLLFAVSFINGVVLADNLLVLLFFWEGLLILMFALVRIGRAGAYRTAIKAFIIQGVADLCMLAGIALTVYLAGTFTISGIRLECDNTLGALAFLLLAVGALAKTGSMPFHSWIPDAAEDAPLGFMALVAVCLDKLAGIYFLVRISVDMFQLKSGTALSLVLMIVGAVTIIAAVMMALVQKNYKTLLSYHAISQAGYMILGIGTCSPAGIAGGIFHMLNNAHYKSGLFFTAGSVEKQAGSSDLTKLGGLRRQMPVTALCFGTMAFAISGVPPFNGFFSKELIYDAALERGWIFYLAAITGTFLTAASFLKLGHCVFLGKPRGDVSRVKEAPAAMLVPMCIIAVFCLVLGLGSRFLLNRWVMPILIQEGEAHLPPAQIGLVLATIVTLSLAVIHHFARVRATGEPLKAADDIHYAPVVGKVYSLAEKKYLDPYEWGLSLARFGARLLMWVDRGFDWIYNCALPGIANTISSWVSAAHSGYYVTYIVWALVGSAGAVLFLLK